MKKSTRTICIVDGCGKPWRARAWCSRHYYDWLKANPVREVYTRPVCTIENCEGLNTGHGLCSVHNGRKRRHGDPNHKCRTNQPVKGTCEIEDCNQPVQARKMCAAHYRAWYVRYDPDRVFTKGTLETFLKGLTENSKLTSANVRVRCLHFGLLEPKCVGCGLKEWTCVFGAGTPFQLDHINGVSNDNRIENLRILCANCHMMTETWGRTKKFLAQQKSS